MPCSDSSSSMSIHLDSDEKFISFAYAKITCGREITGSTGFSDYCKGKTLQEILLIPFSKACFDLGLKEEEEQFVLHLEWDVLRAGVAQYLGVEHESIDPDRCTITAIEYTEEGIEIAEIVLPPKEMPKILPCNLAEQNNNN